jgi:hypothetical protein
MIDFERWGVKTIAAAKRKTKELLNYHEYFIKNLKSAGVVYVSFGTVSDSYDESGSDYTEQERMSFSDFVQIVEAGRI